MDSKLQTRIMIGVALLVVATILVYVSLSTPKVYDEATTVEQSVTTATSSNSEEITENTTFAGQVNLNTATVEQLTAIDGIGDKRANAIIAYRETIGSYTSVDQIMNIEGIGEGVYAQISPYLTV